MTFTILVVVRKMLIHISLGVVRGFVGSVAHLSECKGSTIFLHFRFKESVL